MSDANHNHTPDGDDDFTRKFEDLFRSKVDDVEEAGRKTGLYVRDIGLSMAPMPDGIEPVMVANFTIGEVAWSDRVQNAEQYTTEAEFRKMSVQMDKDKFEETKAELERRLAAGEDPLAQEDDDDDDRTV